mgnify:CR=1 FL=1
MIKKILNIFIVVMMLSLLCPASARADLAPGHLDSGFDPGSGTNDTVLDIAVQADGKVLIVGEFTTVDSHVSLRIARLNADGTPDTSFNPYVGANKGADNRVRTVAVQEDGKILIGGNFTEFNDIPCNRICRLSANGAVDGAFNSGIGFNGAVRAIAVKPNGKILIGGEFSTVNGITRKGIAQLNSNGSVDSIFNAGDTGTVYDMELLSSGKIVIVGSFSVVDGQTKHRVARLNADGTLDPSFGSFAGADNWVNAIARQGDGKFLVAGAFTKIDNIGRNRIARLDADGFLDTSFDPGTGANAVVNDVQVLWNGHIYIGGAFSSINGQSRTHLAQLKEDGALDPIYQPGLFPSSGSQPWALTLQNDNKLLVGGDFTEVGCVPRNNIARINEDGYLDVAFGPATTPNLMIQTVLRQPDGKILIGGYFTSGTTYYPNYIARLNSDGSPDPNFNPGTGTNGPVLAIALQTDGKILIGGKFSSVNGTTRQHIARLNADGSLDTSFNAGTDADVYTLSVQPDGKVLAGGIFTTVNGWVHNGIVRLLTDGTRDTSFSASVTNTTNVYTMALKTDGKILIGGNFTAINGTAQNRIARLNTNGSLDTSFNPGAGANFLIRSLKIIPYSGQLMVAGSFTKFDNVTRNRVARLNADGTLDTSFDTSNGPTNNWVHSVLIQSDNKVLIGGGFTQVGTVSQGYLARLNADGSLDTSFNPAAAIDEDVYSLAGQPDGKVLAAGNTTDRINLVNAAIPPKFTSSLPPDAAEVGDVYSHTFIGEGGPIFYVTGGSLPPGLSLNSTTGLLSGTLTSGGSFTFTVSACNFVAPCARQNISLTVEGDEVKIDLYLPLIVKP